MKFPTLALLSCSILLQSSTAVNFSKPQVRAHPGHDDDLERCFERCGRGKDVEDADDIEECQLDCIAEQVENGRARSALGPNGEFSPLMRKGIVSILFVHHVSSLL